MTGAALMITPPTAIAPEAASVVADHLSLGYARGFAPAAADSALMPLALRLSRLAPANLPLGERAARLDAEMSVWSAEVFGRTLRPAALKSAIAAVRAPLDVVLGSVETVAPFKAAIEAALPLPFPTEIPTEMPEQNIAPMKSIAFLSRLLSFSFFSKSSPSATLRHV